LELILLSNASPDIDDSALLFSSICALHYERDRGAIKGSYGKDINGDVGRERERERERDKTSMWGNFRDICLWER